MKEDIIVYVSKCFLMFPKFSPIPSQIWNETAACVFGLTETSPKQNFDPWLEDPIGK